MGVLVISWTLARSRLATAIETGQPPGVIAILRREYQAARLAHLIRTTAPGLTNTQRADLSLVLAGDDVAA
jgi:hypothetical protein